MGMAKSAKFRVPVQEVPVAALTVREMLGRAQAASSDGDKVSETLYEVGASLLSELKRQSSEARARFRDSKYR